MEEGTEVSLNLDLPSVVKVTFNGMTTYVQEPMKLGAEVEFTVRGFVRKTGVEWIERDETEREFVQVQVTSITQ